MKALRTIGTLSVTGAVLALLPIGSAVAAQTGDTAATFTLAAGSLDITTAGTADLTDGNSGDTTISGPLGSVVVTDERGSIAGWVVSASSTTFVDGADSVSTAISYDSGVAETDGDVTAESAGATAITATAVPVATATASGNNTASFSPILTVTLPASALAGDYTGTVTTSIA